MKCLLEVLQVINSETMISNIGVHVLSGCAVISTTMFTLKTFKYVCACIYMSLYDCTQIHTEYVIKH